jgi:hypothetical protein
MQSDRIIQNDKLNGTNKRKKYGKLMIERNQKMRLIIINLFEIF